MWTWNIEGEFRGWKAKYSLHTSGFTAYGLTKKLQKNILRLFEEVDWIYDTKVKLEFMYGVANKCVHRMGGRMCEIHLPKAVQEKIGFNASMAWLFSETKEFLIADWKKKGGKIAEDYIAIINRDSSYKFKNKKNQLRVLGALYEEYQQKSISSTIYATKRKSIIMVK